MRWQAIITLTAEVGGVQEQGQGTKGQGRWRQVVALAAMVWVVIFWRLGYLGLLDPDEAHYAELTREMMRSGSWFVPLLDGVPYIDKPAFFHWLQIAGIHLLGDSELAMRAPSALAAVGLFLVVGWAARRLFASSLLGGLAASMFLTIPATFALSSVGLFDMTFGLTLFAAVSCLVVAILDRRPRLQYAGFLWLAVAVLVKGPVALALVTAFAAGCALIPATRRRLRDLRWLAGMAIVLVVTVPWFAWMAVSFGDRFVHDYVLAGNLWYWTAPPEFTRRSSDWFFYARTFAGAFFPWSLIALAGGIDDLRARRRGVEPGVPETVLWLWLATILVFFSIARFKLDTYIYPAAPACAILAALAWQRAADDASRLVTRSVVAAIALLLVAGGAVTAIAFLRIDLGIGGRVVLLPAVLAAGGLVLLRQFALGGWRLPATPIALVSTLVAAFAVIVEVGFPLLESSRPTKQLGAWVARHTNPGVTIGAYRLEDWHASIRYYADRSVRRLMDRAALEDFYAASPDAAVLMLSTDYDEFRERGLPLRAVASGRAIVGRTGKVLRRQIWGSLAVVTRDDSAPAPLLLAGDLDHREPGRQVSVSAARLPAAGPSRGSGGHRRRRDR